MSEEHDSNQADLAENHNAGSPSSKQPVINRRTLLGQLGAAGAGIGLLSGQAAATDQTSLSKSDNTVRNVERLEGDAVTSYTDVALSQPTAPLVDILTSGEDLFVDDQTPLVFDIEAKDTEVASYNPTLVVFAAKPADTQTNKAGLLNVLVMEANGERDPVAAFATAGEPPTTGQEVQGTGSSTEESIRMYGTRNGTAMQVADRPVNPSAVSTDQITPLAGCSACTFLFDQICAIIGTGTIGWIACMEVCLPAGYAYPQCVLLCRVFSYAFSAGVCGGSAWAWCYNQGFCP